MDTARSGRATVCRRALRRTSLNRPNLATFHPFAHRIWAGTIPMDNERLTRIAIIAAIVVPPVFLFIMLCVL
jgi:hypothetical protein